MCCHATRRSRARTICAAANIPSTTKIKDLSDSEMDRLREQVQKFTIEGDLRREVSMSIKRLMDLGPRPTAKSNTGVKGTASQARA